MILRGYYHILMRLGLMFFVLQLRLLNSSQKGQIIYEDGVVKIRKQSMRRLTAVFITIITINLMSRFRDARLFD